MYGDRLDQDKKLKEQLWHENYENGFSNFGRTCRCQALFKNGQHPCNNGNGVPLPYTAQFKSLLLSK
jgi:hypothetical protein